MIIRKAVAKDAKRISYLIQKVTDKNPNKYSEEQISAWKRYNTPSEIKRQLHNRVIFCAFKNARLIGTIALKDNRILGFYVSYTIRKNGVGTQLLEYLEAYALKLNLNTLQLTSTPSAFEFYKKRGYKVKKKVNLSIYGVDYPETEMEKIISNKSNRSDKP